MIPKKIHYCWFGNSDIPKELRKCINSWKKMMPDYEIIKWNENNYDINKCLYIKQAYESKKWAFVSDFVRLDVCYEHGGIYLDTDVEVLRSFNELLELKGFCGFEQGKDKKDNWVNTGLVLGMEKGLPIGKVLRDEYYNMSFIANNGKQNLVPCPIIQTNTLENYGLKKNNKVQIVEDMKIFSTEYFCPSNQYTGNVYITNNTFSIHHYCGSWNNNVDKSRREIRKKYSKYGKFLSNLISTYLAYKNEYGLLKMWKKILQKILN